MPRSRKLSNLHPTTNHLLSTYAVAASAAGVSLLALAQPSEAEIIYTPAHATIGRNGSYGLDLNNDGHVDFTIMERVLGEGTDHSFQSLYVQPREGNSIKCRICTFTAVFAQAVYRGSQIGGGRNISFYSLRVPMAYRNSFTGTVFYGGYFANVRDVYLGLKFHLEDGAHFGWARISVQFHGGAPNERTWRAQITGYAYDSTPDTPIAAGQINEKSDTAAQPNSANLSSPARLSGSPRLSSSDGLALGALALGSQGIALWRREE